MSIIELDIVVLISVAGFVTALVNALLTNRRLSRADTKVDAERMKAIEIHHQILADRLGEALRSLDDLSRVSAGREKEIESLRSQVEALSKMGLGERMAGVETKLATALTSRLGALGKGD